MNQPAKASARVQQLELLAYAEACGSLQNSYAAMAEAVDSSEVRYLLLRYELLHARLLQDLIRWQPAATVGQSAPPVALHADLLRAAATDGDGDRAVLRALLRFEERVLARCRALSHTFEGLDADRFSQQARTLAAICRELGRVAVRSVASSDASDASDITTLEADISDVPVTQLTAEFQTPNLVESPNLVERRP